MNPFERFWAAWPRSERKVSKSLCQKKWAKLGLDLQAEEIIKHVEYMKTTDSWLKSNGQFIPAPLVYLNQMRWDGAEIPEVKKVDDTLVRLEESRKQAVPPSPEILAQLRNLRNQTRMH
jgi:hypothetical protein